MITSTSNPQVKNLIQLVQKAKVRNEQRLFVVEGPKLCMEAPREWVEQFYVSESFASDGAHKNHMKKLEEDKVRYEILSDSVFKTVSDTKTPQGILGLLRMPQYDLSELLKQQSNRSPQLLILESIQDPGNLGTMFRTGEGAGITGVLMNKTTVDVFNPKTIRSTMGSIYRVPFYVTENMPKTLIELKEEGMQLYAAHLSGTLSYDEPDYTGATGFLIGNEGNGLSDEIASLASTYIRIPMEGKVESLNAAIAATLLMYEAARQRR